MKLLANVTPESTTVSRFIPSTDEDRTLLQSTRYQPISTLVTVYDCKSGRTITKTSDIPVLKIISVLVSIKFELNHFSIGEVSSFLTAHQHIKGYFVPSRLLWKYISV